MAQITFRDFDLLIERSSDGYTARVLNSPAGQATAGFTLPFTDQDLEILMLRVGRSRRAVRRVESPEMQSIKGFGGKLFDAVFAGDVRACLRSSLDQVDREDAGLRLRLRFAGAPELMDLPWEFIYNSTLNRFLALSTRTPLVRYIELPEAIRPLSVHPPLRILAMISSPRDYPALDVEKEWTRLNDGLGDLQKRGQVVLERLDAATLDGLRRRLRQGEYHIFHYIGHGGFDPQAQDGLLMLEDEMDRGRPASGQYVGTLLSNHRSLRLAVLNACEGARTSRTDPFAGVAQSLVQQGIPAVIAMQFEISDEAAITFTQEFYAAITDGYPVDAALGEARNAIFAGGNELEWGTPVLYLRASDGRIFDVAQPTEQEATPAQTREQQEPAQRPLAAAAALPVPEIRPPIAQPTAPPRLAANKTNPLLYLVGGGGFLLLLAALVLVGPGAPVIRSFLAQAETVTPSATAVSAVVPTDGAAAATLTILPLPPDTAVPSETQALPPLQGPLAGGGTGWLAYEATSVDIYLIRADGAGKKKLTIGRRPVWSPDGKRIAFDTNTAIYVINADGTGLQALSKQEDRAPAWSPDGKQIAFESTREGGQEQLYVMNADGTGQRRLTDNRTENHHPAWSPDGLKIAFDSVRRGGFDICVINADGTGEIQLTQDPAYDGEPAWSPDGRRIAFVSVRNEPFIEEILMMDANGLNVIRLYSSPQAESAPAWSPDGRLIAFGARAPATGKSSIYLMNANGTGQAWVADDGDHPSWQPKP